MNENDLAFVLILWGLLVVWGLASALIELLLERYWPAPKEDYRWTGYGGTRR